MRNFINWHDVAALPLRGYRLRGRLGLSEDQAVKRRWADTAISVLWTDLPAVRERCNALMTGDPQTEHYDYIANKFLKPLEPLTGLSLGCGNGDREFRWFQSCQFARLDGVDLSEPQITSARLRSEREGLAERLMFQVSDVSRMVWPVNHYDVVFGEHSLHHFRQVDRLFAGIAQSLREGGYFIVNEYVGPARFQWTDQQLAAVSGALALLPDSYRCRQSDGSLKKSAWRPSVLRMYLSDPSEAVESNRIREALYRHFDVIELRNYGGTLLHVLLSDIAANFTSDDSETKSILALLFQIEDLLMSLGMESDFMLAICRKRSE